ncbi:hypothetical protein SB749_07710 [Brevibacterium sp. SIMBA_078]|uniref:hypothetical protein n=1 Tax=Brevibacterium sp. SIMBA_078 TaxID=3085816 RepID=UPI00397C20B0
MSVDLAVTVINGFFERFWGPERTVVGLPDGMGVIVGIDKFMPECRALTAKRSP